MTHPTKRLLAALALLGLAAAPLAAQVQPVDPDDAYSAPVDGDLEPVPSATPPASTPALEATAATAPASEAPAPAPAPAAAAAARGDSTETYREDDLIGAAEGVFGKGAKGVADMIRKTLADQGQPNAYIVGREAGGAFVVGLRYGSGTLHHKVEGQRPVYWTGPSVGFDAGASAGSTFVLVYNLYDTEDLYKRFPAGEGQAYAVGGLNASYLRWGDVVLIPIRVGAGLRLGINAGYMKFSKKQNWLPF
ncbi:MAG: DUF1134 domain-containing protein [Altererythrobacter sp.]|nr:DUF1134 domain-containing protein [Altererythrobacter sp.]